MGTGLAILLILKLLIHFLLQKNPLKLRIWPQNMPSKKFFTRGIVFDSLTLSFLGVKWFF
jgi:hypothetical protein